MWAIWDKKKKRWMAFRTITESKGYNCIEIYKTKTSAKREFDFWGMIDERYELRRVRITEE